MRKSDLCLRGLIVNRRKFLDGRDVGIFSGILKML